MFLAGVSGARRPHMGGNMRQHQQGHCIALLAACFLIALGSSAPPAHAQFVCGGSATGAEAQTGASATAAGANNTACGVEADSSGIGSFNTAISFRSPASNKITSRTVSGSSVNTAIGAGSNASGTPSRNTALGANASASGDTSFNVATGSSARALGNSSNNIAIGTDLPGDQDNAGADAAGNNSHNTA